MLSPALISESQWHSIQLVGVTATLTCSPFSVINGMQLLTYRWMITRRGIKSPMRNFSSTVSDEEIHIYRQTRTPLTQLVNGSGLFLWKCARKAGVRCAKSPHLDHECCSEVPSSGLRIYRPGPRSTLQQPPSSDRAKAHVEPGREVKTMRIGGLFNRLSILRITSTALSCRVVILPRFYRG